MTDNLNLTNKLIEEASKSLRSQKDILIKVKTKEGYKEASVTIDTVFQDEKIEACVKELIQKLDYFRIYNKDVEQTNDIYRAWLILLIIKHFSSLDVPYPFKKQLAVLDKMIETEVLLQIFSQFKNKEIEKVMKQVAIVTQAGAERIDNLYNQLQEIDKKTNKKMQGMIDNLEKSE